MHLCDEHVVNDSSAYTGLSDRPRERCPPDMLEISDEDHAMFGPRAATAVKLLPTLHQGGIVGKTAIATATTETSRSHGSTVLSTVRREPVAIHGAVSTTGATEAAGVA